MTSNDNINRESGSESAEEINAQLMELMAKARAAGLDIAGAMGTDTGFSLSEQIAVRLPELKRDRESTYGAWAPYLHQFAAGLPHMCACICKACSTGPCACLDGAHHASCEPEDGIDCSARMPPLGHINVRMLTRHHVGDAGYWARRHAIKRNVARNVRRRMAGRPDVQHDGRGAHEMLVQSTRWLFDQMQ
jgi:hypothetical protein